MADLSDFLLARVAEDEHFGTPTRHLAKRWDAECEAKRRVLAALDVTEDCEIPAEAWVIGKDVLRALALPYADHPDYREEWRP